MVVLVMLVVVARAAAGGERRRSQMPPLHSVQRSAVGLPPALRLLGQGQQPLQCPEKPQALHFPLAWLRVVMAALVASTPWLVACCWVLGAALALALEAAEAAAAALGVEAAALVAARHRRACSAPPFHPWLQPTLGMVGAC